MCFEKGTSASIYQSASYGIGPKPLKGIQKEKVSGHKMGLLPPHTTKSWFGKNSSQYILLSPVVKGKNVEVGNLDQIRLHLFLFDPQRGMWCPRLQCELEVILWRPSRGSYEDFVTS